MHFSLFIVDHNVGPEVLQTFSTCAVKQSIKSTKVLLGVLRDNLHRCMKNNKEKIPGGLL